MKADGKTRQRLVGAWLPLAMIVAFGFSAATASASVGKLDPAFGDGGRAATPADLGSSWKAARTQLAAAPGGLIVASERQLFRYLPDGQLDSDFGEGGVVTVDTIEGLRFRFADVAVDGQGRILAFGTAEDVSTTTRIPNYSPGGYVHPSFVVVLRFDARGALDPSFGEGDGIVRTDLGLPHTLEGEDHSHPSLVRAIAGAVDTAERPVLIGARYEFIPGEVRSLPGWASRLTVRLNEAGALDPSFGAGGIAVLSSLYNRGMAIGGQGEPLLAWGGFSYISQVTRLRENGTADTSYGTAGVRTVAHAGGQAVLDRFGRLTILESAQSGIARVTQLEPNGRLRRSFGRRGRVTVRLPGRRGGASSIAVDARGRILIAGTAMHRGSPATGQEEAQERFVVGRLRASGRLDSGFGHRGWLLTGFGPHTKVAGAHTAFNATVGPHAVLDPRGRLLVVDAGHSPQLEPGGIVLARYLLD